MSGSPESESIEGGCTCGECRYRLLAKPLFVHCCHCTWCQKESGSAFALNALIEAAMLEMVKGQVERVNVPSNSGKGQVFSRCPRCRIALWSNYAGAGDQLHFVRVGTLDEPDQCPPDIHIYTESKQPWVRLPGGVTAVERYYKMDDYWPADSLARFKGLFN